MAENDTENLPRRGRKKRVVVKYQPAKVEEHVEVTYQPAYPDERISNFIRGLVLGAIAGGVGAVLNARQSGALTRTELEGRLRGLRNDVLARTEEARAKLSSVTTEARATMTEFTAEGRTTVADLSSAAAAAEAEPEPPPAEATTSTNVITAESMADDVTRPISTMPTTDDKRPTGEFPHVPRPD